MLGAVVSKPFRAGCWPTCRTTTPRMLQERGGARLVPSRAPLAGYSHPFPGSGAVHPGEGREGRAGTAAKCKPPAGRVRVALVQHRSQPLLPPPPPAT